jgi:predicted transcriptional regulator
MSEQNLGQHSQGVAIELATEIIAAYVGNNTVQSSELPDLIRSVHESLIGLNSAESPLEEQKPAVSVRKSITDDYLICLEDGKKFKSLKRHLRAKYDMSPEEYREKWNLPYDYPMVAPAYARQRSDLAKRMGLGQGRTKDE